jgi:hypothetical protein
VQSAGKAKKTNPDGQEFLLGGSHQTIKQTNYHAVKHYRHRKGLLK